MERSQQRAVRKGRVKRRRVESCAGSSCDEKTPGSEELSPTSEGESESDGSDFARQIEADLDRMGVEAAHGSDTDDASDNVPLNDLVPLRRGDESDFVPLTALVQKKRRLK